MRSAWPRITTRPPLIQEIAQSAVYELFHGEVCFGHGEAFNF